MGQHFKTDLYSPIYMYLHEVIVTSDGQTSRVFTKTAEQFILGRPTV